MEREHFEEYKKLGLNIAYYRKDYILISPKFLRQFALMTWGRGG